MRRIPIAVLRDIAIIFLLSLTPLLWFRPGMIMVGHDLVAPLNPQVFFAGRLFTWIHQFFGQSQALILGTIPIHLIDVIPSYLGFSLETAQKIVYVFWFFLMGVSAYVLAHVLRPRSSVFKLTAALLYQFNFFILQGWWIAEKSKFSSYIAAPLVLATFLLVESGSISLLSGAVLNGIILFLFNAGGMYGLPLYGGFFVIVGSFIVFSLIEHWYRKNFRAIQRLILLILSTFAVGIAINAYFILPAAMKIRAHQAPDVSQIGGVSGAVDWANEISANTSFLNLMRLQGIPDWYDNPEHPYSKAFFTNPLLVTVSFFWPLGAFATLFVVKERKSYRLVLYLFLVYLTGIFFTAGTHPPLGFLYQILVEKIPGFFIFRTPYYKFASALFFANAFLLAFLIDSTPKRIRTGLFVFFCAGLLMYHFPYFKGNFFEWRKGFSTRLAVPPYVFEFGNWLNKEGTNGRVLMVPPDSPDLQYGLYQWGYLSFQALPTLLSSNSVVVNNDKLNIQEQILTMTLYNALLQGDGETAKKLASLLGISHIVLSRDAVTQIQSSIPLDIALYERGVNKTGLFNLERRFGQWDVYGLREPATGKFYLIAQNPGIVDSVIENTSLFVPHLQTKDFLLAGEGDDVSKLGVGQTVIIPDCLTCPKKHQPEVVFPDRNILPGDPFYALVLFSERLRPIPRDPKGAIYNTLGITLKRVSEINQMMFEKKPLTKNTSDRFIQLLQSIKEEFDRLPTLKDKIAVASDIEFYIHAERNLLRPNLGSSVTSGTQTVLSGNIFSALSSIDTWLASYITLVDDPGSRLYQWSIDTPANFNFFLEAKDIKNIFDNVSSLHMTLDDSIDLKPTVTAVSQGNRISFGSSDVEKGLHTLKLFFPPSVETTYSLVSQQTAFSRSGENACFGTPIPNIVPGKLYQMRLRYLNDFSDNLILFVWERGADGPEHLVSAVKLLAGPLPDQKEQILEPSTDASQILIAACAPNLTSQRATKQFTLTLSEIINPSIVISSVGNERENTAPVTYASLGPTRYRISFPQQTSSPGLLVFSERFDPWWELKGVNARHIMVNGYANGWIITSPVSQPILVEYKGQIYFYWGIAISLITLGAGVALLWSRRSH